MARIIPLEEAAIMGKFDIGLTADDILNPESSSDVIDDDEVEALMLQMVAGEAEIEPTGDQSNMLAPLGPQNIQDESHTENSPQETDAMEVGLHVEDISMASVPANKRFKRLSEEEMDNLESHKENDSTKKNTKWGVHLFEEWCIGAGYPVVKFETIEANDLSSLLREFYVSAAPKPTVERLKSLPNDQAQEYHKNTVKNLRAAINRHLRNLGRDIDIVRDKTFSKANSMLDAKLKFMLKTGASRPTQHKKIITQNDMLKISTYLENHEDPQILQYKVWYTLAIHFVSRGLEFHHQLNLHSFLFLFDDTGREYATLAQETKQKNIQGGLSNPEAASDKRMYATGDDGCPVSALRKFLSHCDPSAPALFCRIKVRITGQLWYTCKPLSKSLFSKFMGDICKIAQCSMSYTAHSVRATAIHLLSIAGVETRHIMLMSGHRNEASVRSYCRDCSDDQKREISDRLSTVSSANGNSRKPHTSTGPLVPCLMDPKSSQSRSNSTGMSSENHESVTRRIMPIQPNVSAYSLGSEAPHVRYLNSLTSMSSAQGILTNSSFNNCHFSFTIGKSSQ